MVCGRSGIQGTQQKKTPAKQTGTTRTHIIRMSRMFVGAVYCSRSGVIASLLSLCHGPEMTQRCETSPWSLYHGTTDVFRAFALTSINMMDAVASHPSITVVDFLDWKKLSKKKKRWKYIYKYYEKCEKCHILIDCWCRSKELRVSKSFGCPVSTKGENKQATTSPEPKQHRLRHTNHQSRIRKLNIAAHEEKEINLKIQLLQRLCWQLLPNERPYPLHGGVSPSSHCWDVAGQMVLCVGAMVEMAFSEQQEYHQQSYRFRQSKRGQSFRISVTEAGAQNKNCSEKLKFMTFGLLCLAKVDFPSALTLLSAKCTEGKQILFYLVSDFFPFGVQMWCTCVRQSRKDSCLLVSGI